MYEPRLNLTQSVEQCGTTKPNTDHNPRLNINLGSLFFLFHKNTQHFRIQNLSGNPQVLFNEPMDIQNIQGFAHCEVTYEMFHILNCGFVRGLNAI